MVGEEPKYDETKGVQPLKALDKNAVLIHAGTSGTSGWASKEFPIRWWMDVVDAVSKTGATPVLIGFNSHVNGVHKIEHPSAINLVDKLNLKEMIWILQRAKVLITNDSMPLHAASSREPASVSLGPWIGYLATAKHPDHLLHFRRGILGARMKNLSLGGIWSKPGITTDAKSATVDEIKSWLPVPGTVARWAVLACRGEYDS